MAHEIQLSFIFKELGMRFGDYAPLCMFALDRGEHIITKSTVKKEKETGTEKDSDTLTMSIIVSDVHCGWLLGQINADSDMHEICVCSNFIRMSHMS